MKPFGMVVEWEAGMPAQVFIIMLLKAKGVMEFKDIPKDLSICSEIRTKLDFRFNYRL